MRVPHRTVRLLTIGWAILVVAGLALVAGMSAQAAWRAVQAHRSHGGAPLATSDASYEREDHFPGAALLYAALRPQRTETPAPAAGVTGTTELPALPVSAAQAAAMIANTAGTVPAAPFSMRGANNLDRARALECLTAAIYYEAASEPDAGQSAVAQVILNRVRHPAFPATVCGVAYQGSERAHCQFSFACDGALMRVPARGAWARASRAAGMALAGYVYAPVGLATHYHTYAVTPAWNRSLVMTDVVGAHFFHRWKGFWGTAAAFRQLYRGGEPEPGPHARIAPLVPNAAMVIAAASVPPMPAASAAQIQPAHADSGGYLVPAQPATTLPPQDDLPPAPQILDKWKDSGKPLS